jgi:hypothetical protein
MTANHRRDAYASAGARVSQHRPTHRSRTATQDLAPGPGGRGRRAPRRRQRSSMPTLLVAIGLILGFAVICVLLLERNQDRFDPFTTIGAQLRSDAPTVLSSEQLDGMGRRLLDERLEQGHPQWFAAARAAKGAQQRQVMAAYWNRAARELAADPAIQDAYRRAGLSFAFRGQWFGMSTEPAAAAAAPAKPKPAAAAPTAPAAEPAEAEAEAEPEAAPTPQAAPEPPGAIERLM